MVCQPRIHKQHRTAVFDKNICNYKNGAYFLNEP